MNLSLALFLLLVFPGLLFALPMGWLMLGLERQLRARLQGRIGPPLSQPFYDTVKLFGKSPVPRVAQDAGLSLGLPIVAIGSMVGALALLPALSGEGGFSGDLILLVALLEMPPLCLILAGFSSRSIYGEVGATREAVLSIVANVPFLAALIAMAISAGSLHLSVIAVSTPWLVRVPAVLALLLCLPVKLRLNPFSLANAEQELLAGPLTEFEGRHLGLWEVAHALEWVALTGFVATSLVAYRSANEAVNAIGFILLSLALVPLLTVVATATARLKLGQTTRLLWWWASPIAGAAVLGAIVLRQGGN